MSQFKRQHKCLGPLYLFLLLLVSTATMLLLLFSFLSSLNSSLFFFNSFSMFAQPLLLLLHVHSTTVLLLLHHVHSNIATAYHCSLINCCYFLPMFTQLLLLLPHACLTMLIQLLLLPLLMCTSMIKFNHRTFHRSNDFNRLIRFNRLSFTEVRDAIFKLKKKTMEAYPYSELEKGDS